jgi:peroxiredoxin
MPCRHHLGEVSANADRLRRAGGEILVVTQATPELLRPFLARHPQPVPVVGDPERAAYRAFGLERATWLTFFRPKVLWGYVRLMLRGVRVRTPYAGEDVRQLGGDFLLDRSGRVVRAWTSADPTERPDVPELMAALTAAGPSD